MSKYTAIIFDLGGVLETISPQKTIDAFRKLGVKNSEEIFTLDNQDSIVNEFEIGKISEKIFFEQLKFKFNIYNASIEEIKACWCAMLISFPRENIKMLERLRKNYKLYLLSNTNETHYLEINNQIGFKLDNLFDNCFYSFKQKKRKPEFDFFKSVLNQINLPSSQVFFIDDLQKNVEAARSLGIQSYFYTTNFPFFDSSVLNDLLS